MTVDASVRQPTIMDVAALAQVSHQTVSRYFRSPSQLRPKTLARVEQAVQVLGYRPNLAARSMRSRRSGLLVIRIPGTAAVSGKWLTGASRVAHQVGYVLDVIGVDSGKPGSLPVDDVSVAQADGVLSLTPGIDGPGANLTGWDEDFSESNESQEIEAIRAILEHLVARGHQRFLYLAGSDESPPSSRIRERTYVQTIERLAHDSDGAVVGYCSASPGYEAMLSLDASLLPLVVISQDDFEAANVIRAALKRGWSIPGDISVTGWGNEPFGMLLSPALTTVDVDPERLGAMSVYRLLDTLGVELPDPPLSPQFNVIWRESAG